MRDQLRADLARCGETRRAQWRELAMSPRLWSVVCYRFRRWVFTSKFPAILKKPLTMFGTIYGIFSEILTNIELPVTADIGPGLYIAHTGYIVVSTDAVIGRNCTLTQGVTIGHGGGGKQGKKGSPILGDRVYVGPGAILIGPIEIGDDVLIGAGAVVTRSVPPRGVVVGNPARLLSCAGSFDLITYKGMQEDEARLAAMSDAARNDEG